MSQSAAHLVDHVIPHVPLRRWVLSLPIPLRVLLAAHSKLVTRVLQAVQRVATRHLLAAAGLAADEGHGGAVTLIRRFGSAANLNIHLHCLVRPQAPALGTSVNNEFRHLATAEPPMRCWGIRVQLECTNACLSVLAQLLFGHVPRCISSHGGGCTGR